MTTPRPIMSVALLPALILADGCSGQTQELARLAEEAARRQAAQQEQFLEENRRLAESSRKLVESDAQARQELTEFQSRIQQDIQAERQGVDRQREELDDERRDIEARRHRDPLIAAGLVQAATLIVACLPIVLLILMLRAACDEPADAAIGELLAQDLTSETPLLLPGPVMPNRALEPPASDSNREPPRLVASEEPPSDEAGSTPT